MDRYRFHSFLFWCAFLNLLIIAKCCERSLEVRGVEDYCWTKNVEVVERLQHTGKTVLNFAKKKLGMEVETDDIPQKLNGNGYPCHEKMTNWIKHNVIYNQATLLLSQVNKCSEGLANSTVSENYFYADNVGEAITDDESSTKPTEPQSKCDIASEYMKCMSLVEKDENCPVYQYP